jgi:hypothetical protein
MITTGRALCEAFAAAMAEYGIPGEVLTDIQRPLYPPAAGRGAVRAGLPGERHRAAARKAEVADDHGEDRAVPQESLRAELLDHVAPFESLEAAQAGIDGWVHAHNHQRPHQALDMAVPASRFRPNGPARDVAVPAPTVQDEQVALPWAEEGVVAPPPLPVPRGAAVEFDARVPPSGDLIVAAGRQHLSVKQGLAGRTLTVWADLHSIHLLLDGHVLRTVVSTPTARSWPTSSP